MTSKELAKLLGVSTATVSLVINGKSGISDKTRAEVLTKIRELGYGDMIKVPQPSEKTETQPIQSSIGFVIFKDSGKLLGENSFFPLIVNGIENRAREHGYNIVFINIEKAKLAEQVKFIPDAGCKGFIIFATEMDETSLPYFEALGIPFVIFDNYFPGKDITSVGVDNQQGTYIAVRHLAELGHKRIGYIRSGEKISSFFEREAFAKQAVRSLGLEDPEPFTITTAYPSAEAERAMNRYLEEHELKATAYLTDNDLVAAGVINALRNHGIHVPEDVSIVGYDDRPLCEFTIPKLTTIRLPRNDFGAEAVSRLVRVMDGRARCTTSTRIAGSLVVRESTGPVGK